VISAGQARVAAQAVRDLPREAFAGLDTLVTQTGPGVDAGQLRAAVDTYVHEVAPENLAERERRAFQRRRLNITKTGDGAVAGEFRLDPLGAETVMTAIAARSAPAGADDDRTPEQRRPTRWCSWRGRRWTPGNYRTPAARGPT
jgi:hypothetical protein